MTQGINRETINANPSIRLAHIDGLKVIMLLCVLINHLPQYVGVDVSDTIWSAIGSFGVSGFVLLSGFGLTYSLLVKNVTHIDFIPFFWKRFLRVVPLYYAALFTYLLVVDLISLPNLLAHLFLVHTLFEDFSRDPGSLWFVGLITQCYLVFPLAYQLLLRRWGSVWVMFLALLLYGLGAILANQDIYAADSVLNFSIEFAIGMVMALRLYRSRSVRYTPMPVIVLSAIGLALAVALMQLAVLEGLPSQSPITTLARLCFFVVALNGVLLLEKTWSAFQQLVPGLLALSFASYAVYLFHRPLLTILTEGPIWEWVMQQIGSTAFRGIALVGLSMPIVFLVGYWIQMAYDSSQKTFLAQRSLNRAGKLV